MTNSSAFNFVVVVCTVCWIHIHWNHGWTVSVSISNRRSFDTIRSEQDVLCVLMYQQMLLSVRLGIQIVNPVSIFVVCYSCRRRRKDCYDERRRPRILFPVLMYHQMSNFSIACCVFVYPSMPCPKISATAVQQLSALPTGKHVQHIVVVVVVLANVTVVVNVPVSIIKIIQ